MWTFVLYRALVKKSARMISVGQCIISILPCLAISRIQKNFIEMWLEFLEHDILPFLVIFSAPSLSFHTMFEVIE